MLLEGAKEKKNVDLSLLTTLKIGGKAKHFFLVKSTPELFSLLKKLGDSFYLLGKGSNLLIENKLIKKPVIKLAGKFEGVERHDQLIEVGASTSLSFLVQYCIKNNFSGIEGLAGMPATIGGMLSTHASSFGASIFDYLESVEAVDAKGRIQKIKKSNISYGYRRCSLSGLLIIRSFFRFLREDSDKIKKNIRDVISRRIKKQDFSFPSCGSVFKNPSGDKAGRLIEESMLKGKQKGNVKISEKHANFILNLGNGCYQDADYLINLIKDSVYAKKGVLLEEEVERWK